ncbi:hypothetical protein T492DRAFT_492113 [Pavlovales sp. CCMP2436]|nr:hypothetical protein T492DRAFT_492113 [Pavlovales sp. CCMP2436]
MFGFLLNDKCYRRARQSSEGQQGQPASEILARRLTWRRRVCVMITEIGSFFHSLCSSLSAHEQETAGGVCTVAGSFTGVGTAGDKAWPPSSLDISHLAAALGVYSRASSRFASVARPTRSGAKLKSPGPAEIGGALGALAGAAAARGARAFDSGEMARSRGHEAWQLALAADVSRRLPVMSVAELSACARALAPCAENEVAQEKVVK